jgi:hypothetical protein
MKKLQLRYPWQLVNKGQGFFVPCLDTAQVKKEGLLAAARSRIYAKAFVGIKAGKLGVLFVRGQR